MEEKINKKYLIATLFIIIFYVISLSYYDTKIGRKIFSNKTENDTVVYNIKINQIDGTYVEPKKEWLYYDDTLSDYCFVQIDDSTLRLRCVCSCEEYKKNESNN